MELQQSQKGLKTEKLLTQQQIPILLNNKNPDQSVDSQVQMNRQIKIATQSCNQGRKKLIDKQYLLASKQFSKTIMAFEYIMKNNPPTKQIIKSLMIELIIPAYSNLSLCYLKMENYQSVVNFCNQVLGQNSSHTKCIYRRAIANKGLKKWDEAVQDLTLLIKLDEEMTVNANILIKECYRCKQYEEKKTKKIAQKFISGYTQQKQIKIKQVSKWIKLQSYIIHLWIKITSLCPYRKK